MNNQAIASYRTQQVSTASPEKQAALLMEAGQVFLYRAKVAIQDKKYNDMAASLIRVADIVTEAELRLNKEVGGELVINLSALYSWWTLKLLEVSKTRDIATVELLVSQFGELKSSWEQISS